MGQYYDIGLQAGKRVAEKVDAFISSEYKDDGRLQNDKTVDNLLKLLDGDLDISATYMSEILTDENWSTYKMFEGMASDYINGSADVRKGIDLALSALTGWNMTSISEELLNRNKEE